jgi:hypothetical protein
MKKMMIMTVVLGMAFASQAVTLRWGGNLATSSFKNLSGSAMTTGASSETSSMLVLYVLASDYAGFTAGTTKAAVTALAKSTAIGQASTATSAAGRFAQSSNRLGSSAGIDYVARVYATFGGNEYYLDNITGWKTALSGTDVTIETLAWSVATWGGATGTFGTQNVWVNTVPEPTSMALLALGVAAIGLRRKNRK